MTGVYRIFVTGSDWDDEQELRLDLIHAAVPHLPRIVVSVDPEAPVIAAIAEEWARPYGVRTEAAGTGTPDIVLAFGASLAADEAERAGLRVCRYQQARAA